MNTLLTIIESPYAGNIEENIKYAKLCILDSIQRGETPFASHLFYTQVLKDNIESERNLGIQLGFNIMLLANKVAIYIDKGISNGMQNGIDNAKSLNKNIEYRKIWNEDQKN